jgi:hypothetical protein
VTFVAPYRRIRLSAIAAHLGVSIPEAENIAVMAIRDGKLLRAAIDQVEGIILLQLPAEQCWQSPAGAAVAARKLKAAPQNQSSVGVATGAGARYTEMSRLAQQLGLLVGSLAAQ